jgi:1-acyl-sn-glycerol-3-phosphate acyltransferase
MKAQVYKDPRPVEYFQGFHERTRRGRPDWVYEVVRMLLLPLVAIVYRGRCIDSHKIPSEGPVLIAPNHFSFMDHFFVAAYMRRKVQFMAKSQLFKAPADKIFSPGGVFPVRRGYDDEDAFVTAVSVLDRGGVVAMYAEGGRSRTGELSDKPRRGIGRLALLSGAPVVPVAIHGSHRVRNWKRLQFPKIRVYYGEPVVYERVSATTRESEQAVAEEIFGEVRRLYADTRPGSAPGSTWA